MKTPIDEYPAGPEMDAAVAKALGHVVEVSQKTAFQRTPIHYVGDVTDDDDRRKYEWTATSPYSTDIAAAWELGNENDWCWKFTEYPDVLQVDLTTPERNVRVDVKSFSNSGMAKHYALGRCRAFLKANGVEYVEVPE